MKSEGLDILFLHPPANIGEPRPILDADTSCTDQFVSFPIGFFSMGNNLEKSGYKVKILNLGEMALNKQRGEGIEGPIKRFLKERLCVKMQLNTNYAKPNVLH